MLEWRTATGLLCQLRNTSFGLQRTTGNSMYAKQLMALLEIEARRLRESFVQRPAADVDSRVALIELIRATDVFYARPLFTGVRNDASLEDLYAGGGSQMLGMFSDAHIKAVGIPLMASNRASQDWAHSTIQHSGRLQSVSHLLELARDSILDLSRTSTHGFQFRFTSDVVDVEAFDVADTQWLQKLAREIDKPLSEFLQEGHSEVKRRMRRLIYPWKEQFIGYSADHLVDEHFESAGMLWARGLNGGSELPSEGMIGGHPFYAYRAAVGIMCGRALKHAGLAAELSLMHPKLDMHNLINTWSTRQEWIAFLQHSLEIDATGANDLLDGLTLDSAYADTFASVPGHPFPPLVQVGSDMLMLCIRGCLDGPFWFLLRKLRHRFRKDWDRIVNEREDQFRNELYELFLSERFATAKMPIRIRHVGLDVTDIDAAVFDKTYGTLSLFQLKWQDPFGQSMRERRSKMRNFFSTTNRWIGAVSDWVANSSDSDLLARVDNNIGQQRIKRTEIVVARHHARFSGSDLCDSRAAWGTWPQLCRIVTEKYSGGDLLKGTAKAFRDDQKRTESPRPLPSGQMNIGETSIIVVPYDGRQAADH